VPEGESSASPFGAGLSLLLAHWMSDQAAADYAPYIIYAAPPKEYFAYILIVHVFIFYQ